MAEREEIALLLFQDHTLQEIGRRLGRSASTISREVRRNATTRSSGLEYRATVAQWHAERSARRPKATKLAGNAALRSYVEDRLAGLVPSYGAGDSTEGGGRRTVEKLKNGGLVSSFLQASASFLLVASSSWARARYRRVSTAFSLMPNIVAVSD